MEAIPGAVTPGAPGISSLTDAERFLEGLLDVEKRADVGYARFGLEPIRRLLACVDDPQRALSVVHITGSKGKGSTALLTEAVLREAGERVGTFTSPHLERWTERFRLDGKEVSGEALACAVERLRPHIERLRRDDPANAPTFFDATTAAAFLLFAEAQVDRAVIEVGLGGRLDSTNVVDPAVACITTVELEHTDRLGATRAAIAREKAGIVKRGRPVVTGRLHPEAADVVVSTARELEAPLARLDHEIRCDVLRADGAGLELRLRDGTLDVVLASPLLGAHQAANVALAVALTRRLGGRSDASIARAASTALARVSLPGRVEVLQRSPVVVVDGAHTAESARALAAALALLPGRRMRLVLSVSAGKDLDAILAALLPFANEVIVTRAEAARSLDPQDVATAIRAAAPGLPLHAVPNPFVALRAAREGLAPDDVLCATGSIYLAGIARRIWADCTD